VGIKPLQVVTDFTKAMEKVQHLPAAMIPTWEEMTKTPTPGPSTQQREEQTPPPVSSDVEMEDTPRGSIASTQASSKGKGVDRAISASQPMSKKSMRRAARAGKKRGLSDSPSKVQGPSTSKKAKKAIVETDSDDVEEIVAALDLGEEVVDEDSRVDPEMVPAVVGKVRD
jgi:hypothetical protein